MTKRILIIGGTGVFGKRLARHLSHFDDLALFVSSRSEAKAKRFAATLNHPDATGVALDHATTLRPQLDAIKPFAVIDCSGPFQTASYDTARAVLAAGAHLIDLADARDYLAGFTPALDKSAKDMDLCALTGASSTPTLSACVVDHVTKGWRQIDTIDTCITPGGQSEVGHAVIAAILSYAGRNIPVWNNGRLDTATGWTNARTLQIPSLGRRRVALVETYDAENLSKRHAVTSRITFAAGLESRLEQFGIEAIAHLRKRNLFPNPTAFIPLLLAARKITRIPTSANGGMMVEISGLDPNDTPIQTNWSLIARNDHGPNIPILPAAAALQKLLQGKVQSGATLAHDHLELPDILAQMTRYDIATQTDVTP